jgi:hypothetical protein
MPTLTTRMRAHERRYRSPRCLGRDPDSQRLPFRGLVGGAGASVADPVKAAIERHRRAYNAFIAVLEPDARAGRLLPRLRQTCANGNLLVPGQPGLKKVPKRPWLTIWSRRKGGLQSRPFCCRLGGARSTLSGPPARVADVHEADRHHHPGGRLRNDRDRTFGARCERNRRELRWRRWKGERDVVSLCNRIRHQSVHHGCDRGIPRPS